MITQKINPFMALMRVTKPIGSFLLLWPTLMALWIAAEGRPSPFILGIFMLGTFVMRSAGCVANDMTDQRFDGQVKRTQMRPLVRGQISKRGATALLVGLLFIALILVLQLNLFAQLLSVLTLILVLFYPFVKRFSHFPQVVLAVAFSMGILMAFAAEANHLPFSAFILFTANIFWVIAYDIEYAMVDREDDLKIGVKSMAIFLANHDRLAVLVCQGLALSCLIFLGIELSFGRYYYLCIFVACLLIAYQQWLIRNRESQACFQAFLNNNLVGAVLFLGVLLST